MSRRPSLIVGVLLLVVILAFLVGGQTVAAAVTGTGTVGGPEQPVGFTHVTHAGTLQLDCTFCHRNVDKGANASVPAVEQCMFCHKAVTGSPEKAPEIAKVREAFESGNPIDWLRVHRVPDHVRFVHSAHVKALAKAGEPIVNVCIQCHGNVPNMAQVQQIRPLKMGDCVSCHRQNNAPTDCTTCHK